MDWNRIARHNSGMSTIQLTDDELRILQDHKKGAPHKLMSLKSEAIIMLSMGASKKFAAEFVERSIETIKRWVRQWKEFGLASIRTGHAGNDNASKLTREQAEETRKVIQGGGLEGIKCECRGDGLLECFQGPPVGCVEDSPGFDVGDGALFRPGGSC